VVAGLPEDVIADHKVLGDGFGDPNTEGRVLTAEYPGFYLVTVYTPNTKDDLGRLALRHTQWDPAFLSYLRALEQRKPVIFCGDLNVAHTPDDLANPTSNKGKKGFTDEERQGFQNFLDAGFVDTFRMFHEGNGFYSWWSHFAKARERNVGWRIDYFLVSEQLRDKARAADIHADLMGSDHCPISLDLDL
jgi:exodeoxyribonuclease-3